MAKRLTSLYLENCRKEKSLTWSNMSTSVLREPQEALCMVLFEA